MTTFDHSGYHPWPAAVKRHAERGPDRPALFHGERQMTYGQLAQQMDALAADLVERGAAPGDRVALLLPDSLELVVAMVAAGRAGLAFSTPNMRTPPDMLRAQLQHLDPRVVITVPKTPAVPDLVELVAGLELSHPVDTILIGPELGRILQRPVTEPERAALDERQIGLEDDCLVAYTSGTSGMPKALVHSGLGMCYFGPHLSEYGGLGPDDVLSSSIPLGAFITQVIPLCMTLVRGASFAIMGLPPDTTRFLDALEQHQVTFAIGAPAFYLKCLDDPKLSQTDLSSLCSLVVTGAPSTAELVQKFEAAFGVPVHNYYGSAEGSGCAGTAADDPAPVRRQATLLPFPFPDLHIEIRAEDGRVLPAGEVGTLFVKSPAGMKGYYKRPDLTAEILDDRGWYCIGDLAKFDEEGALHLFGRAGEMFLRGGNNIYPSEIERVLHSHPGVRLAAVVGIPNERLGHVPHAFVIPKAGSELIPDELIEYCRAKMMPYYVPREVRICDALPLTASGKVKKFILLQEMGISS